MLKEAINGLKCWHCNKMLPAEPFLYVCPKCDRNLEFIYDYQVIGSKWSKLDLKQNPEPSIWRYLPLIPTNGSPENTSLQVGSTPLISFPGSAKEHGLANLYIKDDSRNPSASLKDRASEIAIQHAKEQQKSMLVAASTGNAGSSLAALAAHHGVRSIILVPAAAPEAKLAQIRQHGAHLVALDTNYDTAFDLAFALAERLGLYSRNTGINPVLAEGKKTVSLEISEQLNWKAPDHVFVPMGDGCIISGVYKGFYDLKSLGWIDRIPCIHGVQAEGSSAIIENLHSEERFEAIDARTVADSISVNLPRDGEKARRAILNSRGSGIRVSDEEILKAQHILARSYGVFGEPAAAAAFAGFQKASETDLFKSNDTVIVLNTGSGLKDIRAAQQQLEPIKIYSSDPETLNEEIGELV